MLAKVLSCYVIILLIRSVYTTDCYSSEDTFYYNILDQGNMKKCLTCIKFLKYSVDITEITCSVVDKSSSTLFSSIMDKYRNYNRLNHALRIRGTKFQKSEPFILTPDLEIPGWIWSNLLKLEFSGNYISEIVPGFFSIFPDLLELNINNNAITSITENTFWSCLPQLQRLNLSRNSIEKVHESSFQSLSDLSVIDLSSNRIKYVSSKLFDKQRNLELVLLNNNLLADFDISFRNSTPFIITSIDLSFNRLHKIDFMGDVLNVSLNNNNITEISSLSQYIMFLNVSHNNIKHIENNLFLNLSNLRELDLGHNFLESLPTHSFRNSKLLEYIDISYNLLNENIFGTKNNWISFFFHFDKLKTVSLDGNLWECSDLKDILQSLKNKNVKIIPGNEYSKSSILGISCIDSYNTNVTSSSPPGDNMSIIDRIIKQVEKYFENNSTSGKNLSARMDQLENDLNKTVSNIETRVSNIYSQKQMDASIKNNNHNTALIKEINMSKISARIDQLENDLSKTVSNIETRMSNIYLQTQTDVALKINNYSTALINEINYMIETKMSKLSTKINETFLLNQQNNIQTDHSNSDAKLNEEYFNKLFQNENHSYSSLIAIETIIIILLMIVIGILIFSWYTKRKLSSSLRQEGINLVDTNY